MARPPKPEDRSAAPRFKKKGRMRKQQSVRDLSRRLPWQDDLERIWDEFESAQHRTAAIMAAAYVEAALEYAIAARFSNLSGASVEQFDNMFRDQRPFASFGAKIDVGYAIGIYGSLVRDDLNTIRLIRNAFAHSKIIIDFTTPAIVDEVKKLKFAKWLMENGRTRRDNKKREASENPIRYDYADLSRLLAHYILTNYIPEGERTTLP